MRKNIAIFGGSLFQSIKYENNEYFVTGKKGICEIKNIHNIDNYSVQGLNAIRTLRLIKALPIEIYNDCIIALGENDLEEYGNLKFLLNEIIDYLHANNVRPILVSLSEEYLNQKNALAIDDMICDLAVQKNVDLIYIGNTNKTTSYVIKDSKNINNAILKLC